MRGMPVEAFARPSNNSTAGREKASPLGGRGGTGGAVAGAAEDPCRPLLCDGSLVCRFYSFGDDISALRTKPKSWHIAIQTGAQ